jgi:hypothetical protein
LKTTQLNEESPEEDEQMRPVFEMSVKAQPRYIDTDEDDQEQFADLPRQEDEEDEEGDEDDQQFDREEDEEEEDEREEEEDGFNTYAQDLRERLDDEEDTDNQRQHSPDTNKEAS